MDRIHGQRELYRRSCLKETNTQERANPALMFQRCISWELSLNPESREVDVLKTGPGFGQVVELMQQELSVVK